VPGVHPGPIYDLRRDGPYVVLDFGITCLQPASSTCFTEDDFAPSRNGSVDLDTPDGVQLIDPVAHKEYLAVRDAGDHPDASELPSSITDSPTQLAWVRYPAPPASVSQLRVCYQGDADAAQRCAVSL